jgi:outer membrane protein OmpA-like peptidoglycan-associated protein
MSTPQTEPAQRRASGTSYHALAWFVLIGLLALYAWHRATLVEAVGPRHMQRDQVPAAPRGNSQGTDKRVSGGKSEPIAPKRFAGAERAAFERQITRAKERIAELERAVTTARQQNEAARREARHKQAGASAAERRLWLQVGELGGHEAKEGIRLSLGGTTLGFPAGEADLPAGASPTLDRLAELLIQYARLSARIEGHTDSVGPQAANLALSQARADAVKRALVERGVPADRIETVGRGESQPIADNGSPAGRGQNRRIEIYLTDGAK